MAVVKKTLPAGGKQKRALKRPPPAPPEFALSTERSIPSDTLQDYSILLFGPKKIGKSSLAAMFPDAYFLSTEPGVKSLAVFTSPIHDWRTFKKAVKALRKDTRFKNTVVDTVDIAYKFCEKYVCDELGVEHVSEAAWGKGWSAIREEFESVLRDLMSAPGKGTLLISHSTEKEITRRTGEKYDRIQPTMANIARDIAEAMVDIWGYFDYDGNRRVLTIRGDDHITAGHRLQTRFRYEGREVVSIDMGLTKEEGYRNFLSAFNNTYAIPDPEPPPDEDEDETPRVVKKVKKTKAA